MSEFIPQVDYYYLYNPEGQFPNGIGLYDFDKKVKFLIKMYGGDPENVYDLIHAIWTFISVVQGSEFVSLVARLLTYITSDDKILKEIREDKDLCREVLAKTKDYFRFSDIRKCSGEELDLIVRELTK